MQLQEKFRSCISLFSNAGIGDIGVERAGIHVLAANELLPERCKTYEYNHPDTKVFCKDINDMDFLQLKEIYIKDPLFLLVCTPPCQGVSSAGKRDPFDIRNQLIKPTVKAILQLQPQWVWLENVPAYRKAMIPDTKEVVPDDGTIPRINLIDYLKKELEPAGYRLEWKILDAKDYGIPQSRKRLFILMTRTNKPITFPEKTHGNTEGLLPYVTVREAIGHLESLESGEKSKTDIYHVAKTHNENHIRWMKATPEGQTALDNKRPEDRPHIFDKRMGRIRPIRAYRTTYKRIWWDRPAPTVTMCSGSISSQNNVHPKDARALTVRECMLLQTIPDSFCFPPETTDKQMREMIGEAVPVQLAEIITRHIIRLDEKED